MNATLQILTRIGQLCVDGWIVLPLVGAILAVMLARVDRRIGFAVLIPALMLGAYRIYTQAAIFDDAFVTFRYIDNWMRGLGPIYNQGEYVEGYSNPLWMVLVMIGHRITSLEIPLVALCLNVTVYGTLIALAVVASRVHGGHRYVPFAAALLAVQQSVTAYATTGMETLLGSALVLGAFSLMRGDRVRGWGLAGLLLALSVSHRLDHAVFWTAGFVAAASPLVFGRDRRQAAQRLLVYAIPVLLVVAHLALKHWYYGDILPNTYYAKATDQWRVDQGGVYLFTFAMGSSVWLALPLAAWWGYAGRRESLPARIFVLLATPVWTVYILKVGGDFMFSRFCLPLFPVVIVAAEAGAMTLKGRSQLVALAALGATLWGFPVIPSRGAHHWGQANENRIYPLTGLFPITVHHASYREGVLFRELFYERGIEVPMGSCCIGMVGYYSRQPLMDFHGLTDAATAKKKIRGRALPGHEKKASNQEVRERGIRIARWGGRNPKHLAEAAHLRFPKGSGVRRKGYSFVVWDPDLAATLEEKVPEIEFRTFPRWLDRYIRSMRKDEKPRKQVIEDLKWFRAYYFDHNDDPKRLRRIERWLRDSRKREKKREPTEPKEQPSQR